MDPRKVDVSVCSAFFLLEGMVIPKILTCTTGNGSSPPLVLYHLYKINQVFISGGVQAEVNEVNAYSS